MTAKTSIKSKPLHFHWFRQDLRLHDNPALNKCIQNVNKSPKDDVSKGIVPIYCFDPRFVGGDTLTPFGSQKCGVRRARFLLDSVEDLRSNLEKNGSGLVVAYGKTEDFMEKLCKSIDEAVGEGIEPNVVVQEEPASEEYAVDKAVKRAVKSFKSGATGNLDQVWAATLYDIDDLPFNDGVHGIPDTFTPFRNKVEKVSLVYRIQIFSTLSCHAHHLQI